MARCKRPSEQWRRSLSLNRKQVLHVELRDDDDDMNVEDPVQGGDSETTKSAISTTLYPDTCRRTTARSSLRALARHPSSTLQSSRGPHVSFWRSACVTTPFLHVCNIFLVQYERHRLPAFRAPRRRSPHAQQLPHPTVCTTERMQCPDYNHCTCKRCRRSAGCRGPIQCDRLHKHLRERRFAPANSTQAVSASPDTAADDMDVDLLPTRAPQPRLQALAQTSTRGHPPSRLHRSSSARFPFRPSP